MKNFLRFKYILIIIIVIQIFSSSILMYLGHYQYSSVLKMHTEHETLRANKIYNNLFLEVNKIYSTLAVGILTPEVIEAFDQKDREKLHTLTLPKFNNLKKLNEYLKILHFHTADLHSFLRLHKPEAFGDDLSEFRPILVKEREVKKFLFGLEFGKHGVFYRVVLPIYKNEKYIGSMELGIDIKFLIKRLNQFTDLTSFMLVEKKETKFLHGFDEEKASQYLLDYDSKHELIKYYEDDKSEEFLTLIRKNPLKKGNHKIINVGEKTHLLFGGLILENFAKKHIGSVVFMEEGDYYFNAISTIRWISITATLLLLLFSVFLIFKLIKRHTNSLQIKEKELIYLANTDQLTKVDNRHSFTKIFASELKINSRNKTPMSFLMIDIDNFKLYNDNYGHPMGDKVLKKVAQSMKGTLKRPNDHIFRIGGEEFVILFSGLSHKESLEFAQSIIKNVQELNIEHKHNEKYDEITISVGFTYLENYINIDEELIYQTADKALYEAKKLGKNTLAESIISR